MRGQPAVVDVMEADGFGLIKGYVSLHQEGVSHAAARDPV